MKFALVAFLIFLLSGCSVGHYYVLKDDPNSSSKLVYKDSEIWVSLHGLSGEETKLLFSARNKDGQIPVVVKRVELQAKSNGVEIYPAESNFREGEFVLSGKRMFIMSQKYDFSGYPDEFQVLLKIEIDYSGKTVKQTSLVNLRKVEYGYLGTLMSI